MPANGTVIEPRPVPRKKRTGNGNGNGNGTEHKKPRFGPGTGNVMVNENESNNEHGYEPEPDSENESNNESGSGNENNETGPGPGPGPGTGTGTAMVNENSGPANQEQQQTLAEIEAEQQADNDVEAAKLLLDLSKRCPNPGQSPPVAPGAASKWAVVPPPAPAKQLTVGRIGPSMYAIQQNMAEIKTMYYNQRIYNAMKVRKLKKYQKCIALINEKIKTTEKSTKALVVDKELNIAILEAIYDDKHAHSSIVDFYNIFIQTGDYETSKGIIARCIDAITKKAVNNEFESELSLYDQLLPLIKGSLEELPLLTNGTNVGAANSKPSVVSEKTSSEILTGFIYSLIISKVAANKYETNYDAIKEYFESVFPFPKPKNEITQNDVYEALARVTAYTNTLEYLIREQAPEEIIEGARLDVAYALKESDNILNLFDKQQKQLKVQIIPKVLPYVTHIVYKLASISTKIIREYGTKLDFSSPDSFFTSFLVQKDTLTFFNELKDIALCQLSHGFGYLNRLVSKGIKKLSETSIMRDLGSHIASKATITSTSVLNSAEEVDVDVDDEICKIDGKDGNDLIELHKVFLNKIDTLMGFPDDVNEYVQNRDSYDPHRIVSSDSERSNGNSNNSNSNNEGPAGGKKVKQQTRKQQRKQKQYKKSMKKQQRKTRKSVQKKQKQKTRKSSQKKQQKQQKLQKKQQQKK